MAPVLALCGASDVRFRQVLMRTWISPGEFPKRILRTASPAVKTKKETALKDRLNNKLARKEPAPFAIPPMYKPAKQTLRREIPIIPQRRVSRIGRMNALRSHRISITHHHLLCDQGRITVELFELNKIGVSATIFPHLPTPTEIHEYLHRYSPFN